MLVQGSYSHRQGLRGLPPVQGMVHSQMLSPRVSAVAERFIQVGLAALPVTGTSSLFRPPLPLPGLLPVRVRCVL